MYCQQSLFYPFLPSACSIAFVEEQNKTKPSFFNPNLIIFFLESNQTKIWPLLFPADPLLDSSNSFNLLLLPPLSQNRNRPSSFFESHPKHIISHSACTKPNSSQFMMRQHLFRFESPRFFCDNLQQEESYWSALANKTRDFYKDAEKNLYGPIINGAHICLFRFGEFVHSRIRFRCGDQDTFRAPVITIGAPVCSGVAAEAVCVPNKLLVREGFQEDGDDNEAMYAAGPESPFHA